MHLLAGRAAPLKRDQPTAMSFQQARVRVRSTQFAVGVELIHRLRPEIDARGTVVSKANNDIVSNGSNHGGGIRIGNPSVPQIGGVASTGGVLFPTVPVEVSPNSQIDIMYNNINQNGSFKVGGGIALYKGAGGYNISNNMICGNFSRSGGGGIAHSGFNQNGNIKANKIVFNEVFQGDQPGAGLGIGGGGGGIEIAGDVDLGGGLSDGTGDVHVNANLIQGNLSGAENGGGIMLRNINGQDVKASPNDSSLWHRTRINNNLIVNNVAAFGGGGISMRDVTKVSIRHNTIANNDSTATSVFALGQGVAAPSVPLAGGVLSRVHSNALIKAGSPAAPVFSDPIAFRRNIITGNRSFVYDSSLSPPLQPNPAGAYWDDQYTLYDTL